MADDPDVADGLDVAAEPDIEPDIGPDLDTTRTSDDVGDTDAPETPTSGSSGCGGSSGPVAPLLGWSLLALAWCRRRG